MKAPLPHVVVLSSLFPSRIQPGAGLFIRERMFRVARRLPLAVVAPVPWCPFQTLLRRWKPGFRPGAPSHEIQEGVDVWYPRFLSIPSVFKRLDGLFLAIGAFPRCRRLKKEGRLDLIDAHFGYPDGHAASLLGRWLDVPVSITLRGTEARHARDPVLRPLLLAGLRRAGRVFSVSESLRQIAVSIGIAPERVRVVGNGVDLDKFVPMEKILARRRLGIPERAPVLISVGGLVERKGFHRVIECLPELCRSHPGLQYLIVGGAGPEGDWSGRLKEQVAFLGLGGCVRFLGAMPSSGLALPLSAADVFVLATRNEGWANVFLEAMACGLPVVTTDVGGNREVVCRPDLGTLVPFGDGSALAGAVDASLRREWNSAAIRRYAEENAWDGRVDTLVQAFGEIRAAHPAATSPAMGPSP